MQLTQLTHLGLACGHQLPPLAAPPTVRQLELDIRELDPAALTGMQELWGIQLRCRGLVGEQQGTADVLAWLLLQQQLTSLHLNWRHVPHAPEVTAYSALAASSSLKQLHLEFTSMPPGAWSRVFHSQQQLPQLTTLSLPGSSTDALQPQDLQGLAQACPALQQLELDCRRPASWAGPQASTGLHQPQLSQLLPLTALTALSLGCVQAGQLSQLVQLTWLRDLSLQPRS